MISEVAKKRQTSGTQKKATKEINVSMIISVQVYPLLGKSVYLDVLEDLNIQCVQALFEADQVPYDS